MSVSTRSWNFSIRAVCPTEISTVCGQCNQPVQSQRDDQPCLIHLHIIYLVALARREGREGPNKTIAATIANMMWGVSLSDLSTL